LATGVPAQAAQAERGHGLPQLGRSADVAAPLVEAHADLKPLGTHWVPRASCQGPNAVHGMPMVQANTTMTNATVAQMVKGVEGDEITLKYKDGEKKIVVVPTTAIVTYLPGDKSELKPGAKIFISAANKKEDGTLETAAISVGRDGITPPM
jgi:hypothetical protein